MTLLCALLCCEAPVEPGSAYCFTHQRVAVAGDVTADSFDPEVEALKSAIRTQAAQLTRIEALVVAHALGESSDGETLRAIREELGR